MRRFILELTVHFFVHTRILLNITIAPKDYVGSAGVHSEGFFVLVSINVAIYFVPVSINGVHNE